MKYRNLGKTNLKISEIGIGTWQLANDPGCWVGGDFNESLKALNKYVEVGGNFIDTAWGYGYEGENQVNPTSEDLIGKFLKETGKRSELIIASKIAPKNWTWPAFKGTPINTVFPKEHMEKLVNESLKKLGTDYIDLMQFHVWQDDWANEDEWKQTIENLTKQGKVRYWGISINDYQPSNCLKTLDTGLISTIQFIFNIFHQKPTEKLLPYAKANNIGLIARVPLDEGGLTGKWEKDHKFAKGDFRNSYFSGKRLDELVDRTRELKKLLGKEAGTLTELALRYILSFDEISTVIPGMRKVEFVESNTVLSDGRKLSTELLEALKKHSWERNFYTGLDPWLEKSGYVEE
ncbi:aldo/keto reductase [candidate division WWE3 bacterium RBG_13_37_7]|uniref:Aldo/keto reductase n=1 Tax=candidate division WWE3 bacterium RBG_13_37_7 TaxID=1802609 RepID=A0A1F4U1L1_UNCKA|nr:MAG: aldo/keto reductase [candidate division WWE3 bacterium RBG_13_37_7]